MTVYLSELRFENGEDFVEIVATDGEDLSGYSIAVYDSSGKLKYTHSLAGEYETTVAGTDVYLIDRADGLPDMGQTWGVALIDGAGGVVQFVSGEATVITAIEGPAAGATSQPGEVTLGGQSIETSDGGQTYVVQTAPNPGSVPCFAPGTRIATPHGPRSIEDLRPGDEVMTEDMGPQPIRWIRSAETALDACGGSSSAPILIPAGAIAPGRPGRDLILSSNHRVLIGGAGQFAGLLAGEALAPAKAFACLPRIRPMRGRKRMIWWHFALDRHAIIQAEGLRVETLLLGEMVLHGLSAFEIARLRRIFAQHPPGRYLNGPPARPLLSRQQAEKLLALREICALFTGGEIAAGSGGLSRSG